MSLLKFINSGSNSILNYRSILCTRNAVNVCEQSQALISHKALEKLGIPLPPKRPLIPYMRFAQTVRPRIVQSNPKLSITEVVKEIAQEWSKYNPEKKKDLQKEYLAEMEIYLINFEKYKATITPEQKDLIKNFNEQKQKAKQRAIVNEKVEALGKPKRPPGAFIRFMQEKKAQKTDSLKQKEWIKVISKEWETMPENNKNVYKEVSKAELEKYQTDLLAWEENMIRQGHTDVVRNKELYSKETEKKKSKKSV